MHTLTALAVPAADILNIASIKAQLLTLVGILMILAAATVIWAARTKKIGFALEIVGFVIIAFVIIGMAGLTATTAGTTLLTNLFNL